MQCSRTFLFQMCLSLLVSTGSCRCKPLNEVILTEDPEGFFHSSDQDLIEEDEAEADTQSKLESFLGTMKEEFLRKLNLSEAPQEQSRLYPPQFMLELYNKYASDTSAMPRSDVIRSFTLQDVCQSEKNISRSKYRLLFNVTVPDHEEVSKAELRLFTLPEEGSFSGVRGTIRVYQLDCTGSKPTPLLLEEREVMGSHPSWEAFDVTQALHCWLKSSRGRGGGFGVFEVVVDQWEGGRTSNDVDSDGGEGVVGERLDVSVAVGIDTSAALLVFSDDLGSKRREARKELREMMLREEESVMSSAFSPQNEDHENINNISDNSTKDDGNNTARNGVRSRVDLHPRRKRHRRKKRQAESNYCRRTSMRVNFKDIGWDKWIVAPPEYDAFECRGVCFYPLTNDMTPSKHALIQTLVNLRDPKKANMACCVPTKLDPITVMYQEKGIITVRHMYAEMKVAACGCR